MWGHVKLLLASVASINDVLCAYCCVQCIVKGMLAQNKHEMFKRKRKGPSLSVINHSSLFFPFLFFLSWIAHVTLTHYPVKFSELVLCYHFFLIFVFQNSLLWKGHTLCLEKTEKKPEPCETKTRLPLKPYITYGHFGQHSHNPLFALWNNSVLSLKWDTESCMGNVVLYINGG